MCSTLLSRIFFKKLHSTVLYCALNTVLWLFNAEHSRAQIIILIVQNGRSTVLWCALVCSTPLKLRSFSARFALKLKAFWCALLRKHKFALYCALVCYSPLYSRSICALVWSFCARLSCAKVPICPISNSEVFELPWMLRGGLGTLLRNALYYIAKFRNCYMFRIKVLVCS